MSKGFKIALAMIGVYCLIMSPLIWEGLKDGNVALGGGPMYLGLLIALVLSLRQRAKDAAKPTSPAGNQPLAKPGAGAR